MRLESIRDVFSSKNRDYCFSKLRSYKAEVISFIGLLTLAGLGAYLYNRYNQSPKNPTTTEKGTEKPPQTPKNPTEIKANKQAKKLKSNESESELELELEPTDNLPKLTKNKTKPTPEIVVELPKNHPDIKEEDLKYIPFALVEIIREAVNENNKEKITQCARQILATADGLCSSDERKNIEDEVDSIVENGADLQKEIGNQWEASLKVWAEREINTCVIEYQDRESFIKALHDVHLKIVEVVCQDPKYGDHGWKNKIKGLISVALESYVCEKTDLVQKTVQPINKALLEAFKEFEGLKSELWDKIKPELSLNWNKDLLGEFEGLKKDLLGEFEGLKSGLWDKIKSELSLNYLSDALSNEVDRSMLILNKPMNFDEYKETREVALNTIMQNNSEILNESHKKLATVSVNTIFHDWLESQLNYIKPEKKQLKDYEDYLKNLQELKERIGNVLEDKNFIHSETQKIESEIKKTTHIIMLVNKKESFDAEAVKVARDLVSYFEDKSSLKTNLLNVDDAKLMSMLDGTHMISDCSLSSLDGSFLKHKQMYGTEREQKVFGKMDLTAFQNRQMVNRPLAFYAGADHYITLHNRHGSNNSEKIGTPTEKNLYISDTLSYDEMALSANKGFLTPTQFINSGFRQNSGRVGGDRIEEGIYSGMVGARFEKPGLMEDKYMVVYLGVERNSELDKIWCKHLGLDKFPSFADVKKDPERFIEQQNGGYFDTLVYKKGMKTRIQNFMDRANNHGTEKKLTYAYVIGLGLGEWMPKFVDKEAAKFLLPSLQLDLYKEIIAEQEYSQTELVDFAYIVPPSDYKTFTTRLEKDNDLVDEGIPVRGFDGYPMSGTMVKSLILKDKNQKEIKLILSQNQPAEVTDQRKDKLLFAMFAWDGGSYPGNEFWQGKLSASGDTAAAACSTICYTYAKFLLDPIVAEAKEIITNEADTISEK